MLKVVSILFLLSLNISEVFCQDVIVQVDATKKSNSGELIITKTEIMTGNYFFEKSIAVIPGSITSYKFSNDKAGLFEVNGHRILISALADSIHVVNGDNGVQIYGKYVGNYKIWTKINSVPYPYLKEKLSGKNISDYIMRLDSAYSLKLKILDSMKNTLSQDAVDYMIRHINYGYTLSYLGKIEPSNVTEVNTYLKGCKHIKSISFQDFQDDTYADMTLYLLAGHALANVYAIEEKKEDHFIKHVEVIINKFAGLTRERLLKMTFLNTKIIDSIAPQRLDSLMPFIRKLELSESAMRIIDNKYHTVKVINQPISKNIQQKTILKSVNGKKITLERLLSLHKGRTIVFDLWASWCGPCIAQISNLKKVKAQHKDLQIVYISLDTSEKAWLSAAKKYQIEDNQYLLGLDFKSELARYLRIDAIPKYLVISKTGLLVQHDAPPPSVSEFYDRLELPLLK